MRMVIHLSHIGASPADFVRVTADKIDLYKYASIINICL